MPRENVSGNAADPDSSKGRQGWRAFGDGLLGRIVAARLQGFSAVDGDYRDVAVDSVGQLLGVGGGVSGGGVTTIADGADVAQGATTDLPVANTVVGVLKAIKAAITGTLTVGTHAVTDGGGSLTVDGGVSVTNFPATQAVSAAALPLPAGASTESTLAAVNTATGAVADAESGAGNGSVIALLKRARTILGDISSDLGVPTDLEATGNGSLIAIVKRVRTLLNGGLPAALGASGGLKVEQMVAGPTQPVSGTLAVSNFPATQAVSAAALPLPAGASTEATLALLKTAAGTSTDVEQTGDGSLISIQKRIRTLLGGVLSVSERKDGTRVLFVASYSSAAPPTADTAVNVTPARDGVAGAAVASIPITAGKRLRIEAIVLSCRATAATLPWAKAVLRMNPTGAAAIGSPLVFHLVAAGNAAAIGNAASAFADIPDGVEFSGAMQLGLSISGNVATNQVDVTIIGFEYTP